MITFVTDVQENEIPFPLDVFLMDLIIVDLDNVLIMKAIPPSGGWTHEVLEAFACQVDDRTRDGADAYLGVCWVGSTEV